MRRLPIILLAAHSALVIAVGTAVFGCVRAGYLEGVQLWGLVAFVDLPMTPVLALVGGYVRPYVATGTITKSVLLPGIEFLILGGAMWFLVGWVIRQVWLRKQLAGS